MGHIKDIALQLEEAGIPDEVYREATVADALKILNAENIEIEQIDGKWMRKDERPL